ncbi:DoxX family protein [Kribbella sp. NBC_00709]|uniref:DoxX family protein n=1 Tax=Kribbella sp. NBC_00709 TaxID=2975972 RepID=UPI002E28520E|nr:DoxX family protein [Kribbella sp. NBC_00709]
MNVITWIFSGALAVVFTISGVLKGTMSRARLLASGQTGIAPFPMPLVRVTAYCELLAVVGLFAPWLTDRARVLTPLAAVGLVIVMIGAATSHSSLREPRNTAANTILLALAAFVAAARFASLT